MQHYWLHGDPLWPYGSIGPGSEPPAEMRDVAIEGLPAARHLHGEIYEVRASGDRQSFRVLFANEGRRGQVLLALDAFSKKTQQTPQPQISLAERRLIDWRTRGRLSHS